MTSRIPTSKREAKKLTSRGTSTNLLSGDKSGICQDGRVLPEREQRADGLFAVNMDIADFPKRHDRQAGARRLAGLSSFYYYYILATSRPAFGGLEPEAKSDWTGRAKSCGIDAMGNMVVVQMSLQPPVDSNLTRMYTCRVHTSITTWVRMHLFMYELYH